MGGPRSMGTSLGSQHASGDPQAPRPGLKSAKLLVQHFEHAISTEYAAGLNTHYSRSHSDLNHPGLSRAYTHNLPRKPLPDADDAQLERSRKTKNRSTYYYDQNHRFQSQPPLDLPSSSAPTTFTTIRDRDKDKSPLRHSFRNLLTLLKKGSGKLGTSSKDTDRDKPIFPPPKLSTTTVVHQGNASSQTTTKKGLPLLPIPLNDVTRPVLSRSHSRSGTLIYLTTGDAGANDPGNKRPPIWTTANVSLDNGKIALSWYIDSGRRGDMMTPCVHEIDLIGCTDIRSMDIKALKPHSAEALEAWGSGNNVGEDEELKIFEILFERKHREVFAVRSVRERAKWISAFWDAILPHGSGEGTSIQPLPGNLDERKSHREEDHLSRPASAVPPRLTSRTNTERSLPPLPTSQLASNKPNLKPLLPALTIPGKSNDSFIQITSDIVKSDSNKNTNSSSDSRTLDLPTPLKMRPHPSSQSHRVLQVKNGVASPTSMYSRSTVSSAFSFDSGQSSSTGTARRLSSSRPASPSITNLNQLSVVKQRLAQLERTASASPSLKLSVRSSGGASVSSVQSGSELRKRGWGGSGPASPCWDPAGLATRPRAGSPFPCVRVRSGNEPERIESRKELSIDDSDAGSGSHEGGRAGGSRRVGDPPAVKNTGASRTTGLATHSVEVEGSVWNPISGLPSPELGPGGLISSHTSSAPEESQSGGEKQLGLDLHREGGPSASACGDGGDEACTPSGGFPSASAIHNENGVFGKDRQRDEPVSMASEEVGGLAAISKALRDIKSVLGGPGPSRAKTNGNPEDLDSSNVHGSGGGGDEVDVPSIHQITLGLDHRLNGANETLSAVKEILEGMEGCLRSRGDDDHGSNSGCRGNGAGSSSRPRANGGAASAIINIGPGGGGLDRGDAPDVGALLRDIKMQLASGLPAINDRISELNVNARGSRDADNRPFPGDDVNGEGVSAGQVGGDLIPLQTKLEELLALVGTNQVESAAANQGLREEVTAIVSILEDDVGHREQQVLQQADSVRYLNELNKWLEAFVNNGTSQLRALSENIDRLCVELGTTTTITLGGENAGGAGSGESNPGGAGSTHLLSNIRQLVLGMKARDQSMASLQAAVNDLVTTLSSEMRIDSKTLVQMMELQKQNQEFMLRTFTDEISGEIKGERLRFVEAMKEATAINVQQQVEQFKQDLGREVLVMAKELEGLQHEKRNVEHQIANLVAFYSKQKAGIGLLEDDKPANHNFYLQRSTTHDTPTAARTTKPLVINNARSYRLQSHNQNYHRPASGRPLPYPREAL